MSTSNFFDTGQRNRFPVPEDMFNLNLPDSNGFMVTVDRGLLFFCKSQKITLGKLREYFTDKAIELFEHDGYITIERVSKIQQILVSDEIKKVYAEYVGKAWLDDNIKFDATEVIREYLESKGVEIVHIQRNEPKNGQDIYGMTVKEGGNTIGAQMSFKQNF